VFRDQLEPRLGNLDQVEHLAAPVGDLDELDIAVVTDDGARGSGRPLPDGIEQSDEVVLIDRVLNGCYGPFSLEA